MGVAPELTFVDKLYLARRVVLETIPGVLVYISMLNVVLLAIKTAVDKTRGAGTSSNVDVDIGNVAAGGSGPIADLNSSKADNACNSTFVTLVLCVIVPFILYCYWMWEFMKDESLADKHDYAFCFYLIQKRNDMKVKIGRALIIAASLGALFFVILDSGEASTIIPEIYTSVILIAISIKGVLKPFSLCPPYPGYKSVIVGHGALGDKMIKEYEAKPAIFEIERFEVFPFISVNFNLTTAVDQIKGSTMEITFEDILEKSGEAKEKLPRKGDPITLTSMVGMCPCVKKEAETMSKTVTEASV